MPGCYYTHKRFHQYYHHEWLEGTTLLSAPMVDVSNKPAITSGKNTGFFSNTRVYNLFDISFISSGTSAAKYNITKILVLLYLNALRFNTNSNIYNADQLSSLKLRSVQYKNQRF